jgi:CheY-like chemotaxis protein
MIYDDDQIVLDMLKLFFTGRGYEVLDYIEPVVCPLNKKPAESCDNFYPCADVIISDYQMPKMTGIELLQNQSKKGCKVDIKMKAIMSGCADDKIISQCSSLGYSFFHKPFTFSKLSIWLSELEKLFDLSQQLAEN